MRSSSLHNGARPANSMDQVFFNRSQIAAYGLLVKEKGYEGFILLNIGYRSYFRPNEIVILDQLDFKWL